MTTNTLSLNASIRTVTGKKLSSLRAKEIVPGIVYGRGVENILVSIPERQLKKVYSQAGENTLINLNIEGASPKTVLIYDALLDPIKERLLHIDFFIVRLDEKVTAEVPLEFIGVSMAVKELGGTLVKLFHDLEVEALPQDIPHTIQVEISTLATFENQIRVKDIAVSGNFKILAEPEEIVARVMPPRTEEELSALEGAVVEEVAKVEGVADKEPEKTEAKKEAEGKQGKENKESSA